MGTSSEWSWSTRGQTGAASIAGDRRLADGGRVGESEAPSEPPLLVLGLNAFHADASAALFRDGELVAALAEERLSRVKHAAGFPARAAREVLRAAGAEARDLDHVAISRDPRAHLAHKLLYVARRGGEALELVKRRLENRGQVRDTMTLLSNALGVSGTPATSGGLRARLHHVEHHRAHLASAFFASGWDEAACLSIDGFGDFASSTSAVGAGSGIRVLDRVLFPHSAGLFYTAITQFIGFPKYGEEWKLMGLAPYGRPVFREAMARVLRKEPGGRYSLDLDYFQFQRDAAGMTWDEGSPTIGRVWTDKLRELLGAPRDPDSDEYLGRWADLAASAQAVYEDVFLHVVAHLAERTGQTRLCLAGGCALNSVANAKVLERTRFREVYVQPASGDDGTALGAAAWVGFGSLGWDRARFRMAHAYTGPAFDDAQIERALEPLRARSVSGAATASGAPSSDGMRIERLDEGALVERVAQAIADGKVVGWFQGRMEFGPRALGGRSILADPRRADMRDRLNERIKHRETFRPFAPSVLAERAGEVFERGDGGPISSPFMLMVHPVREAWRARVPAITHVDGSGRVQTVSRDANPRYHALITAFCALTGVPLVLNTSFNEHEPIVCKPEEAVACFERTRMDVLAIGPFLIERTGT